MIIGACGFGSTGSSVVTDYLKEFDDVEVKDDLEFNWISRVDGLIDVERAVMNPHNRTGDSIVAIRRFLALADRMAYSYELHGLSQESFHRSVEAFVDAITTAKWYWYDSSVKRTATPKYYFYALMRKKIIPRLEKKQGRLLKCWPLEEVHMSVKPENFYDAAQQHVDEMLRGFGVDQDGMVALDQPFCGNNPQACFPFYRDPRAIIVDRDPRDCYVFARTKLLGRSHFMPTENVDDYIAYYRALRRDQPYLTPDPRILRVQFEDLVYEYDRTTRVIRDFLHLPDNPRPRSVFDPELSIANTQVFKRFPRFSEEIKAIERALPEYVFDFSRYPEPAPGKKMFFGKSPLHENFNRKNHV